MTEYEEFMIEREKQAELRSTISTLVAIRVNLELDIDTYKTVDEKLKTFVEALKVL